MAEFRIDQVTPGAGTPGRSRHDLVPGEIITLVVTAPLGAGVSYTWEILDKVGSTAVLSSLVNPTTTIGPLGNISDFCAFRIKLIANDNGTITETIRIASVRSPVLGLRAPLFPETAPASGKLSNNDPDSSEDNAVYPDRAGLGAAEQNWRGWAEWAWELGLAVEAGTTPSGAASGDLSGTYPGPTVAKLQGRNVDSGAPADQDVLTWDAGTSKWVPLPTAVDPYRYYDLPFNDAVTGVTAVVVGSVYLESGLDLYGPLCLAMMGTQAGGTATLRLRRFTTGILLASADWDRVGAGLGSVAMDAGNVYVSATDWYDIELLGDAAPTVALLKGLRLVLGPHVVIPE